ncbi:uncharacterized protein LOC132308368 [Cornus florida]|uniref:uncharacterized protein LOC132308368 n=1 Tax=Cornus florida TaxID=4283 RepID=UPI00289A3539|nr:uncharacterized protein LOC132308368 [Cornus florida]
MESESPPRPICCFWYSSRSNNGKKKSQGGRDVENNGDWGKTDEILSDMSTFSVKEQDRRLKKAMKEEDRVSRQAERVVEWVKQESARMDVSVVNSVLREDNELIKNNGS